MKPPVLASLALYYALRRKKKELWLAIMTAAILQDGLNLGPFGPSLLAFSMIAILTNRIRDEVFAEGSSHS